MAAKRATAKKQAKSPVKSKAATKQKVIRQSSLTRSVTLTDKEYFFIEQYFICGLNGTEAALAAYDTDDRAVASVIASENLAKPKIRDRVNARLDQFHLNADEVLARMAFHARGSMEHFIDPDSGVIDLAKAKAAKQLGLIKRYKTKFTTFTDKDGGETETTEIELELYDAQTSLRDIGKHLNLFALDASFNLNNFNFADMTIEQLEAIAAGKKPIDVRRVNE